MYARTLAPQEDTGLLEEGNETPPSSGGQKGRLVRLAVGATFATAAVLGVAVASTWHSPTRVGADGTFGATELAETASDAQCAALGSNCASSKCCKNGGKNGYQCFAKNENWAQCMEEKCEPGVHEGEKEGTYDQWGKFVPAKWSCDKLGDRSGPDPCSAPGEDCRKSKCCSAARGGQGMTCFEKDENWASCAEVAPDGWGGKALGERTKFPAGCGWAGSSCADEHLCCNLGFVCAVKDETWTACTQTKKKTTWMTQSIPIPAGWDGTVVGGGRDEYQVPAAAEGQKVAGTKLYCFMAYLPDSYEVGLWDMARKHNASVYACDLHDTFHSWKSAKAGWDTGEATLSNTDVFINVWANMKKTGKYLLADWTVKVDADAVLVPDRLKAHLAALRPPAYRPLYIKNNAMDPGMGNNGFLGAIEVFSKQAVAIYFDNAEGCHKSLGVQAGEDGYFKGCMDALGVGFMVDAQLFNPDKSPGGCAMGQRAGYHPLKTAKNWLCCLDIINGIKHNVVYGDCQMPDPLAAR